MKKDDKVRVINDLDESTYGTDDANDPGWVEDMDKYKGQIGTIRYIDVHDGTVLVSFSNKDVWWFRKCDLEIVNEENSQ